VFEWWKVIERWNHEELLWKNWYYKKMLELQSGF
jgi:ABC-type multidrug transport system fused ATPase/permease subunit